MCGIIGAVGQRDVRPILLDGLMRLEYRGYDSAGLAILDDNAEIKTTRILGKVAGLAKLIQKSTLPSYTGIAHTRWATHGKPSLTNAHPHVCKDAVALVHNGIIENHDELRADLIKKGYTFNSETDSEVVINQIHHYLSTDFDVLQALAKTKDMLQGAYALGVICKNNPNRLLATRQGSPLVIGIGINEYFIASDIFALFPVTQQFIILQEGDIVDLHVDNGIRIFDSQLNEITRPVITSESKIDASDKAGYRHYMLKEIFNQPNAVADTLEGRLTSSSVIEEAFGTKVGPILDKITAIHIVACGTSYHAGLVARHWLEQIARIHCTVEIASEYRYRDTIVNPGTLFVCISQSGETADTLAALKRAKTRPYSASLCICNVPGSSITHESDLALLTRAGIEIGVASTKAFTTQLVTLMLLVLVLARRHNPDEQLEKILIKQINSIPVKINQVLELDKTISRLAERFINKHHALYLGRGSMLPIAMEGALKLKEISYIHAEAYAAGELKHGPLALVDEDMPVIAVAPNNDLLKKLDSNLHEVRARGGKLYVFADSGVKIDESDDIYKINIIPVGDFLTPIIYTVPLQLFAYHVAVFKGADVDQPRNLAKSLTVD